MRQKASSFFQTGLFPRLLPGNFYILYIPYILLFYVKQQTVYSVNNVKKRYLGDNCIVFEDLPASIADLMAAVLSLLLIH